LLFIGDDWAEAHHDIEIQDDAGHGLARSRLREGMVGITAFHRLVAEHLNPAAEPGQVLVGIETERGPWVQALLAAGYKVYAINPLQVARYRERHSASGRSPTPRTRTCWPRSSGWIGPITGDSEIAEHVKVAARAHQRMIWSRVRQVNELRSLLREYYPAALAAFGTDLADRDALAVLAAAPSPEHGKRLSQARIETLLRRAGRQRNLAATAAKIKTALGSPQLGARPGVVPAYPGSASALIAVVTTMVVQTEVLARHVEQGFGRHPDAEIYRSQPGLGVILGARVLAELGDDPHRYADARSRKNYSGMSPITRASGTKKIVLARYARNRRLGDALFLQAYSALRASPGARATTTAIAPVVPPTTRLAARSRTGWSASCTAACATAPSMPARTSDRVPSGTETGFIPRPACVGPVRIGSGEAFAEHVKRTRPALLGRSIHF